MVHRAAWVPNEPVSLVRLEEKAVVVGNPQLRSFWSEQLAGAYVPSLMWRLNGKPAGQPCEGVRDDNRSALLPQHRFLIGDQEYFVAVKGCGAASDAYGHSPLTADVLRGICRNSRLMPALGRENGGHAGFITAERWFGNTPYGGQAPDNAMIAMLASLRANGNEIAGFHICPILALVQLPEPFSRLASSFFWYRRYEGDYWQEIRLMPSNVRVYFQSPITFGADTGRAFSLFKLSSFESCEHFLERLARSMMAALTLYARTLRHESRSGRYLGLGYHDVWLDKDAVIAPDGTLHFADLEGIEDIPASSSEEVREQIRAQFYRNVYEASFALEAMAIETERFLNLSRDRSERRRWLLEVLQRACMTDPYIKLEENGQGLTMVVNPAVDDDDLSTEIVLASEVNRR